MLDLSAVREFSNGIRRHLFRLTGFRDDDDGREVRCDETKSSGRTEHKLDEAEARRDDFREFDRLDRVTSVFGNALLRCDTTANDPPRPPPDSSPSYPPRRRRRNRTKNNICSQRLVSTRFVGCGRGPRTNTFGGDTATSPRVESTSAISKQSQISPHFASRGRGEGRREVRTS